MDITTVWVVLAERDARSLQDTVDSIRWAARFAYAILVVDPIGLGQMEFGPNTAYWLCPEHLRQVQPGFQLLDGLREVIDRGWEFHQVICLRESSLVLNKGLDEWVQGQLSLCDLAGVEGRYNYDDHFDRSLALFAEWGVPTIYWPQAPNPAVLVDTVFACKGELLHDLFRRGLMPPHDCGRWPLPFGCFLSWVTQLLGHYQATCGRTDVQKPPFYVREFPTGVRAAPPPHILIQHFMIYHSLRFVEGYSEEDLRAGYQAARVKQQHAERRL